MMKRELETLRERGLSRNVRHVQGSFLARLSTLFGAGVSLGFVLFVALASCSLMNRGSQVAWASWRELWEVESPRRNLVIPQFPSTLKAQPYRPAVVVQRAAEDYRLSREQRLFWTDLWGRFNQTLSQARNFTR